MVFTGDPPFFSQADDDFWLDYNPPDDPFGICLATLGQMRTLITDEPTHRDDPQLLNRMVLSQSVTALETYLFDTLVRRISQDRSLIAKLLNRDKHINQEKFTLRALAANEKLLEEVRKYLGGVLYHNLERVKFLYEATFLNESQRGSVDDVAGSDRTPSRLRASKWLERRKQAVARFYPRVCGRRCGRN